MTLSEILKNRGHSNPEVGSSRISVMEPTLDEIAAKWHCGKCHYLSSTERGPNWRRVSQSNGRNSVCTNKKSIHYNGYRETNQDGCGLWKKWRLKRTQFETFTAFEFKKTVVKLHNSLKTSLGSSSLMKLYRELIKTHPMSEEDYKKRLQHGLNQGWWYLRSGAPLMDNQGHLKIGHNQFYYLKLR